MSQKTWIILGVVAVLLIGGGVAWKMLGGGNDALSASADSSLPPDKVQPDDKTMGDPKAPLVVVEYFAQSCSVCAAFNQQVFPQLKAKYIDTGKVRYVMRLFPLFPIDGPAHKLVLCLPKEQFYQGTDLLFRNQAQWDTAEYRDADPQGLIKMARIMGMSESQAQACMNSNAQDDHINAVAKEGMDRYNIQGTPTIVIDYKKVDLPKQTWEETDAAIEAVLAAKGVK
jgi:protein-disulfide isomerase